VSSVGFFFSYVNDALSHEPKETDRVLLGNLTTNKQRIKTFFCVCSTSTSVELINLLEPEFYI